MAVKEVWVSRRVTKSKFGGGIDVTLSDEDKKHLIRILELGVEVPSGQRYTATYDITVQM